MRLAGLRRVWGTVRIGAPTPTAAVVVVVFEDEGEEE